MAKTTVKKESEIEKLMKKLKPAQVRFIQLYMGMEDGKCYNNATLAYLTAYDIDTPTRRVKDSVTGKEDYTAQYKSAKTNGYKLLTNADIQKLRNAILDDIGINTQWIKRRYSDIASQSKNLPLALASTDRLAKITGVVKEDNTKVDIPQLTELGETIKALLTPKK